MAWIKRDFVESNHDSAAVTEPFRERQRSVSSVTTYDPWQWWMVGNWFLSTGGCRSCRSMGITLDDCSLVAENLFIYFSFRKIILLSVIIKLFSSSTRYFRYFRILKKIFLSNNNPLTFSISRRNFPKLINIDSKEGSSKTISDP